MPPGKVLKNLHTVVAILVLFEQFLGKSFAPKSECFTKYDAFCLYIFDYAFQGVRFIVDKRFEILEKLYSSKTCWKMAGRGNAPPTSPSWIRLCSASDDAFKEKTLPAHWSDTLASYPRVASTSFDF